MVNRNSVIRVSRNAVGLAKHVVGNKNEKKDAGGFETNHCCLAIYVNTNMYQNNSGLTASVIHVRAKNSSPPAQKHYPESMFLKNAASYDATLNVPPPHIEHTPPFSPENPFLH